MGKLVKNDRLTHPLLDELRKKQGVKLRELVKYVNTLLPVFSEDRNQSRYRRPLSERTVRYYIREGLIDRPVRYEGCYAVFSYRHILQALVIRHLQSDEKTLKEISRIVRGLSNQRLEVLFFSRNSNGAYLDRIKLPVDSGTLSSSGLLQTCRPAKRNVYIPPSDFDDHLWRRFRINDRLELHIMDHPDVLTDRIDIHSTVKTIVGILTKINQGGLGEAGNLRGVSGTRFGDRASNPDVVPTPIESQPHKVIALVTEGGLVPLGNPDRLESAKSKKFLRYSLRGIDDLRSSAFESISGGWDNRYINADPDRLLPLDVMREIANKAKCLKIHEYFYTTTGTAMSLEVAKKIGENIAQELKRQGVSAVIFTST